ncbi:MAG: hypothetical protein BJ554DRAFT_3813 [Olpidium bornovanus]|uniref:Uncharacterized protein n=1 Tax=Olpidium bornovanus TaxID=278681 RepID=A0A8H7ZNL2_9FUNG|nr:MAG: hypothetical protein BJ554DRAFT_3813 [Olpidium bornovanus]
MPLACWAGNRDCALATGRPTPRLEHGTASTPRHIGGRVTRSSRRSHGSQGHYVPDGQAGERVVRRKSIVNHAVWRPSALRRKSVPKTSLFATTALDRGPDGFCG